MRKYYEILLKDAEKRARKSLRFQVTDKNSPKYGGFMDGKNIVQPKFSIYRVVNMAAAYMNSETALYKNEEIRNSILIGLDYIKREQRPNGTFDLVDCNFFRAPIPRSA